MKQNTSSNLNGASSYSKKSLPELHTLFIQKADEIHELVCEARAKKETERYDTLKELFSDFHALFYLYPQHKTESDAVNYVYNPEVGDRIYLSEQLLKYAITCYFDSIYRYKVYARTERADKYKQAAYLYKWIAKIKPIQLLCKEGEYLRGLSWVNSYFATYVALSFVFNEEKSKKGKTYDMSDLLQSLNKDLYWSLIYQAQYRNISGRCVAIQMIATEEACMATAALRKHCPHTQG